MENSQGASPVSEQYREQYEVLHGKTIDELKEMARILGVPQLKSIKRKSDWVDAIITFCSTDQPEENSDNQKTDTQIDQATSSNTEPVPETVSDSIPVFTGNIPETESQSFSTRDTSVVGSSSSAYGPEQGGRGYGSYSAQSRPNYQASQGSSSDTSQSRRKPYQYTSQPQTQIPAYPADFGTQSYSPYRAAEQQRSMRTNYDEQQYSSAQPPFDVPVECEYILEVMPDGYGFLRSNNYLSGPNDVYVSNQQIKKYRLRTGDIVRGKTRRAQAAEKYPPLLTVDAVNDMNPDLLAQNRVTFDKLIPIYPTEHIILERKNLKTLSLRLLDLFAPIGKGQRGLIVSQPKAGKTTLLKDIANSITQNYPDIHLIVLLIDERPEEVTDIRRSVQTNHEDQVEVLSSTFDELPDHHTKVAEMVMERAMRMVEMGRDVFILMDSITRLTRAYNITMPSTGKTLSGGMDPSALFRPKRFFGAARNIENGGSLTIIATALVETGSRMDDIVYEEFKGTGNMEVHLDRSMSEKRIFPAIDIYKSGTRHDELLLTRLEYDCITALRRTLSSTNTAEVTEQILNMLSQSEDNAEFIKNLSKWVEKYLTSD